MNGELVERIRERAEVGRYSGHASTAARLRSELVDTSPAVAGLGLADANSVNGYLGAGALSDVVSRNGLIRDDEGGIKFRSTTTDLGIVADLAERETVLAALELAESLDVRERRAYWALSTSDPAAQETIRATDNPYEAKTLAIPALYDQWDPTPPYRQLAALLRARI